MDTIQKEANNAERSSNLNKHAQKGYWETAPSQ